MDTKERAFWFFGILMVFFFTQENSNKTSSLETLIKTYELESNIQQSQLVDLSQQMDHACRLEYEKGFEAGKTQSAIILMNKDTLYDYADGYHAAVNQFEPTKNPDEIYRLFIEVLESNENSNEDYKELLDILADGKTN